MTHARHHVELHCHGDDIEPDDCGDGEVKVLWRDRLVDDQSRWRVVDVVGSLKHFWKGSQGELKAEGFKAIVIGLKNEKMMKKKKVKRLLFKEKREENSSFFFSFFHSARGK